MDDRSSPGLLEALWRYRWSSALIVVLTTALGVGVALLISGDTSARARIALATPPSGSVIGANTTNEASYIRYAKQRALFAVSDRVLSRATDELGYNVTLPDLRSTVTADVTADADAIVVTATDPVPERAVGTANAVVAAYQEETQADAADVAATALRSIEETAQRVRDGVGGTTGVDATAATETLAQLDLQASAVRVEIALFGSGIEFVDPAALDAIDTRGPPVREAVVGLVLGMLLAATLSWLRADSDRRVRDAESPAEVLQAPLLGEVPDLSRARAPGLHDPASMPILAYQSVTSGLRATSPGGIVQVTSAERGEGRTVTAANIAVAAARDGVRVLLVDADPSSRQLSRMFGLDQEFDGLTTLSRGRGRRSLTDFVHNLDVGGDVTLQLIPAGALTDSAPSLFRSAAMAMAATDMREQYDLVVLDCPPLPTSPEASALVRHADRVLVVVRRGARMRGLRRLAQQLSVYKINPVGYVFIFGSESFMSNVNGERRVSVAR